MINLGRPSFVLGLRTQNSHTARKTIHFGFDFIKSGHGVSDSSALGKVGINGGLKTKRDSVRCPVGERKLLPPKAKAEFQTKHLYQI